MLMLSFTLSFTVGLSFDADIHSSSLLSFGSGGIFCISTAPLSSTFDLHQLRTGALTGQRQRAHESAITHWSQWSVSWPSQCEGHLSNVCTAVHIRHQLHSAVMNILYMTCQSPVHIPARHYCTDARRWPATECNACNTPWTYLVVVQSSELNSRSPSSPNANADN